MERFPGIKADCLTKHTTYLGDEQWMMLSSTVPVEEYHQHLLDQPQLSISWDYCYLE